MVGKSHRHNEPALAEEKMRPEKNLQPSAKLLESRLQPQMNSLNMKMTKMVFGLALALTFGLTATLKAQNIYVTTDQGTLGSGAIGEYGLNGSTINASLVSGLNSNEGIAISGNNLFVANLNNGTVGAYTTSGSTVNPSLISGLSGPEGIAVSGSNLLVANYANNTVGEYTMSGAMVNASLISVGLSVPHRIAISGGHVFILSPGGGGGYIGEYGLDGSVINTSLISGLYSPTGISISGNDLFVTSYGSSGYDDINGTVGEYTTSGAVVNASLITGLWHPFDIAILGNDLFVANSAAGLSGAGTIGEYTTSGQTVNASLVSGLTDPRAIAIGPVPEPPTVAVVCLSGAVLWLWRNRK